MLTPRFVAGVPKIVKRNIGIVAPALQKASDPIQQLFLDKIREYKSKSVGGKMVDPTPEIEKERKSELEKLAAHYGGGQGVDMTSFPTFKFEDPKVVISATEK
ncbi:ATP synthase-coupling factor 6, mitochondrial [Venturia canescens]|uniref:ATP synthase-coupling factor 6, mitochondrial n=1 Tax=Venturia canescens TaxID=32260 RepID=UPI001C9D2F9E|nr:ATP synthase-coupling factor 6, mitochondrial [Venturia canescens]